MSPSQTLGPIVAAEGFIHRCCIGGAVARLSCSTGPEMGLHLFRKVPRFKVLVYGEMVLLVGFCIQQTHKILFPLPLVVILLANTGNDFARVPSRDGGLSPVERQRGISILLHHIEHVAVTVLDRGKVTISNPQGKQQLKPPKFMNNYLGIGCDAKVALDIPGR
ncbi:hypothetical protein VNO77_03081 [Canavalia gladiata]|uniref:Uncharacterized protein n=1 Tax=Canavalia gladiata TaxID=3824 RepID=A0AAN9RBW4_CANGL